MFNFYLLISLFLIFCIVTKKLYNLNLHFNYTGQELFYADEAGCWDYVSKELQEMQSCKE